MSESPNNEKASSSVAKISYSAIQNNTDVDLSIPSTSKQNFDIIPDYVDGKASSSNIKISCSTIKAKIVNEIKNSVNANAEFAMPSTSEGNFNITQADIDNNVDDFVENVGRDDLPVISEPLLGNKRHPLNEVTNKPYLAKQFSSQIFF